MIPDTERQARSADKAQSLIFVSVVDHEEQAQFLLGPSTHRNR